MFFTGDASGRKRVDLGGRSSKESDRQKILEQSRFERQRRLALRQENAAALTIQKCFRGRRAVAKERLVVRQLFFDTYGSHCQNLDIYCFCPDSDFLRQMLFFFNANDTHDFNALVEICQKLLLYAEQNDATSIFAGKDYCSKQAIVDSRLKRLTYICLLTLHHNKNHLKEQFSMPKYSHMPSDILLETVAILINPSLPWACKVVGNLTDKKIFHLLQEIILCSMRSEATLSPWNMPLLDRVIGIIASHTCEESCSCQSLNQVLLFFSEIISIPFLWKSFPHMKEVFATQKVFSFHIQQLAKHVRGPGTVLPCDTSDTYPASVCLLGNLLELARMVLSNPSSTPEMAIDFASVASFLLESVPPLMPLMKDSVGHENEMDVDEDKIAIDPGLQRQILGAMDSHFLEHLVNAMFRGPSASLAWNKAPSDSEFNAIGAICYFLHVAFLVLPAETFMTALAYRTEIVLILWNCIKWCHENERWPTFSRLEGCLPRDAPGWLLPLAVFCPVYKYMLTIVDNEEFYEQEKPLSLKDIRCLVIIFKKVLWELLWINPGNATISNKPSPAFPSSAISIDIIKSHVRTVTAELLNQLLDWNNRQPFMPSNYFHALEAIGDSFISQVLTENGRGRDILKQAPFLIPFNSRVKIFTSQLAAARQRDGHHPAFTRYRFKIRRDQIFEDAFSQLRGLSEEELRGTIRISFINELGAEEAGIDGGGIFKDFIESIAQKAFDVQYGLFKETNNHQLYPNPGSGVIHEQHLQFFHFLGSILGKAMFEGILIDIPFATFFLSKLKQKRNYLNDLPSLDPELYHHLLFLKHYKGDISDLELYFVVVNNDYGEQTEEELLPGGKNIRVTSDNVITFIHLVAHYRLNFQIRHQGRHFLRGFEQLIQKEWIDMFSEHEIQLLISGSTDGLDVDDLRSNAQYSGGYHEGHTVVLMLWEVIKYFSKENQMKFLKFVTGCSRGPLLGFKYLEPKFCIQRAAPLDVTVEDLDRLPTSATCMNLLKLPPYKSKTQLKEKLLYAINAEAGFDLS